MDEKTIARFWAKVRRGADNECWVWTASRNRKEGYGRFWIAKRKMPAHRVSWVIAFGNVEDGACVLHRCDNRLCVNPKHLFEGTLKENTDDMRKKGRQRWRKAGEAIAKLCREQVEMFRSEKANGASLPQLAAKYGISETHARRIANGSRWKNLQKHTGTQQSTSTQSEGEKWSNQPKRD